MKNNILFVTDKFCDADPVVGISNSYSILLSSLKNSGLDVNFNVIHYDEIFLTHNIHIDNVLEKICNKYKPNIIIFSLMMGPKQTLNPSFDCINNLKNKGYYTCFIWPDIQNSFGMNELKSLNKVANLHVAFGGERNIENNETEIMWLWAPVSSKLFFPSNNKNIDVSFIGSLRYQDRQDYLKYAINKGINIFIQGGQRERKLSIEQYASFIRNSKIGINFPQSPGGDVQVKGRVFEIIGSNSLLLEEKNNKTSLYLEPNKHYVEYENMEDFIEKIKYYLSHLNELDTITKNGYSIYNEKYNAKSFWRKVFDRIGEDI